jgi:hypothetical protein
MDNIHEYEDNFVYNGKPYNYYLEYKVKNHSSELQIFLIENDEISEFPITKITDLDEFWEQGDYGRVTRNDYKRTGWDDCEVSESVEWYTLEDALRNYSEFRNELTQSVKDYVEKYSVIGEETIS